MIGPGPPVLKLRFQGPTGIANRPDVLRPVAAPAFTDKPSTQPLLEISQGLSLRCYIRVVTKACPEARATRRRKPEVPRILLVSGISAIPHLLGKRPKAPRSAASTTRNLRLGFTLLYLRRIADCPPPLQRPLGSSRATPGPRHRLARARIPET